MRISRFRPGSSRPRLSRKSLRSSIGIWAISSSILALITTLRAPSALAMASTFAEIALPVAALPSSTLQTYSTGLAVIRPSWLYGPRSSGASSARRAGLPSRNSVTAFIIRASCSLASFSPLLAFFSSGLMRFSRLSRSASMSSVSTVSASDTGSILPSTWVMSSSMKQRSTWATASTSRILARNWLPSPSPLEAPRTRPAISTKVMRVGMISCEPAIWARVSSRGSGTATSPTLGSMVQKG